MNLFLESKSRIVEVSKATVQQQPLKPKLAIIRKDYGPFNQCTSFNESSMFPSETLHAILTRLYRGTRLSPTPRDI